MSGQNFSKMRNVELSTIKYIEDSINASWTGINVVKGFPNFPKQTVPVIAVTLESVFSDRREIGSRVMNDVYNIIIEIFGSSNANRLDLAQFIQDKVVLDWVYYTHSKASGSDEDLDLVDSGDKIQFLDFTQNTRVSFFDDVEFYDRYRHIIAVNVRVD